MADLEKGAIRFVDLLRMQRMPARQNEYHDEHKNDDAKQLVEWWVGDIIDAQGKHSRSTRE